MSETHGTATEYDDPWRCELRVEGHLDDRWADLFEGLRFTYNNDGTTVLSGPVVDQAALHSLLRKVRDLGIPLLPVVQSEKGEQVYLDSEGERQVKLINSIK